MKKQSKRKPRKPSKRQAKKAQPRPTPPPSLPPPTVNTASLLERAAAMLRAGDPRAALPLCRQALDRVHAIQRQRVVHVEADSFDSVHPEAPVGEHRTSGVETIASIDDG